MKLSNVTLHALPEKVKYPLYDRSKLTPGIVHIGLGNFHRAHQAWYLQQLMQEDEALDWAIIGAGVRHNDIDQRNKLAAQDYLTTLIELDPASRSAEVIGSMIDFVPVEDDNQRLIAQMADPAIRIVALTVTEGGYYLDPVTKALNINHPDIQHDAQYPNRPRTAFGAIIAALKLRYDAGFGAFTGLSCDNLQTNGDVLRHTVISLARLSDANFAEWIDAHCTFPNSVVDCIVPATGASELALAVALGIDDAAPVTHEHFRQWIIEDKFCAGRPDWDKVGAIFSDDVHAYETMKIRILNGGHQVIANVGEILSIGVISDCMAHPLIRAFFRKIALEEIVPQVMVVPGMTPEAYVDSVELRFSNPAIVDTVRRVAFDGASRHTGFLLPTLHDALDAEELIEGLALAEAFWARMCEGTREDGTVIEPNDPMWEALTKVAKEAKDDPQIWLDQKDLYGDLAENVRFKEYFVRWLGMIWRDGAEAALQTYLQH